MKALNDLRGEEIQAGGFMISTPKALRTFLQQRPELIDLRRAINSGEVTPDDITAFVEELLLTFCRGEHFADEITLAAVAVAIRNDPRPFAEEYLEDLAKLKITELPLAPRVARICLDRRHETVIRLTDRSMFFSGQISNKNFPFRETTPVRTDAGKNDDHLDLRIAS